MEKKKQLNVYLDKETHKRLKIHCIEKEIQMKQFVKDLIEKAVK